ncbi:hypothetical protein DQ04_00221000 [Trypanosoma grayi]|uniref:hypothetical protein n=1 Tax=Trypanosoma grayi TaxID=71804 RepID=UPI0004F4742A|nr:hypothetical protein DQ04_00221000 [Trypanosoma grayi]KEG14997.1 hypothetical protein DQ04_00221000 [Trypanosoma grayi]
MLRTFAAFELVFAFPWDMELVLLPRSLSVVWSESGVMQKKPAAYFWRNRRCGEAEDELLLLLPADVRQARARGGWSYCFGYLCALYYAQLSLREQRKRLQRRDVEASRIMSAMGTTRQGPRHAVCVTRGLGSAYFELAFAVDSLLGFTQNVVGVVAREMEGSLTTAGAVNSCITLCQRLDALVLRLRCVCFPVAPQPDDAGPLAASAHIRECITAVLAIALDPASLPLKCVTSRTQSAIEALVAVVRALPSASVLREHVGPLLVLLTFNRFYGQ